MKYSNVSYGETIEESKNEFLRNSWSFVYWGIVGSVVPVIILLLRHGFGGQYIYISNYPLFLFPLAGLITTVIIVKDGLKNKTSNPMSVAISFLWGFASVNVVVISFGFPLFYGKLLVGTVFIVLSIAQATCGVILKLKSLIITGILMSSFVWIYLGWYQSEKSLSNPSALVEDFDLILLIIISIVSQFVPGLILIRSKGKN